MWALSKGECLVGGRAKGDDVLRLKTTTKPPLKVECSEPETSTLLRARCLAMSEGSEARGTGQGQVPDTLTLS